MAANRGDCGLVLIVVGNHFDRTARRQQSEVMRRRVLIERHRVGAALLQGGFFLHLFQVFFVRHALRHRRMLRRQQQRDCHD